MYNLNARIMSFDRKTGEEARNGRVNLAKFLEGSGDVCIGIFRDMETAENMLKHNKCTFTDIGNRTIAEIFFISKDKKVLKIAERGACV